MTAELVVLALVAVLATVAIALAGYVLVSTVLRRIRPRQMRARGGDPDLLAWCERQGLPADLVGLDVLVLPDGDLVLWLYRLDDHGRRYLDGNQAAHDVATFTPTEPCPTLVPA